jgi:hypothetical protein
VPLVKPVTVIGEEAPVPVSPPGVDVTVYPVIAVPPLLAGAVNVTEASKLDPAVAVPIVGAPGTLHVVILLLAELAALVPMAFVAVTVNVYAVPVVRPETVIGEEAPVPVILPGLDVTVYPVIAEPPSLVEAVNVTEAVVAPVAVAVPITGILGAVLGIGQLLLEIC